MADPWHLGLAFGVGLGSLVTLIGIVMAEELAVEPPAEIDWVEWAANGTDSQSVDGGGNGR